MLLLNLKATRKVGLPAVPGTFSVGSLSEEGGGSATKEVPLSSFAEIIPF